MITMMSLLVFHVASWWRRQHEIITSRDPRPANSNGRLISSADSRGSLAQSLTSLRARRPSGSRLPNHTHVQLALLRFFFLPRRSGPCSPSGLECDWATTRSICSSTRPRLPLGSSCSACAYFPIPISRCMQLPAGDAGGNRHRLECQ
jgi:hypothetical protein